MALVDLLFKTRVRFGVGASEEALPFGAVQLDASIQETHVSKNEVTQFPVEEGVDITDHVRKQPDRVTIRGIVTDTPILGIGVQGVTNLSTARSIDAYGKALYMLAQAQLISVVTSLNTYSNMVIESLEVPRDSKRGQSVEMNLTLREVMTAQVALTAGTTDLGTQNTTAVS